MSRIGRKPIVVPTGVEIKIADGTVSVKGKNGELKFSPHPAMKVSFDAGVAAAHDRPSQRSAAEPGPSWTDAQPAQQHGDRACRPISKSAWRFRASVTRPPSRERP